MVVDDNDPQLKSGETVMYSVVEENGRSKAGKVTGKNGHPLQGVPKSMMGGGGYDHGYGGGGYGGGGYGGGGYGGGGYGGKEIFMRRLLSVVMNGSIEDEMAVPSKPCVLMNTWYLCGIQ